MTDQLIFNNAKILVVGDVMLDIYKHGKASRISPEAPVPIVLISREDNKAGGAANVAINLKQLGCGVVNLVGYVGNDYAGNQLIDIIYKNKINGNHLVVSAASTITKTRILANEQHIIRYDEDSTFDTQLHRQTYENILIQRLKSLSYVQLFDIVVISDYAKGTITDNIMETIKSCFSCPIICDFKPVNQSLFHNVFCVTPNLDEAKQLANLFEDNNSFELTKKIKQSLGVETVVITLSQDGICSLDQHNDYRKLNARVVVDRNDPIGRLDVTGAGDTVISTLAACLAINHSLSKSVELSNLAAAIVVNKTGTATCSIKELQNEIDKGLIWW